MIARLTGRLAEKELDHLVIDVAGVGYLVQIGSNTFYALPEPPGEVTLQVRTVVREDDIALYGFLSSLEKRLFVHLNSVSKVGPKAAMSLLSAFTAADLLGAIAGADVRALSKVSGIGKKTAERIIVDLGDKAVKLMQESDLETPAGSPKLDAADQDAVSALINLGFKEATALDSVATARRELDENASLEDVIRAALRRQAKG